MPKMRGLLLLSLFVSLGAVAQSGQFSSHTDREYTYVPIEAPFPGTDQTLVYGINNRGDIVGSYHNSSGPHGFIEHKGAFTTLDAKVAGAQNTTAFSANDELEVVGSYTAAGITHGYLWREGVFTPIDVHGTAVSLTIPHGINDFGTIVGLYTDATGTHGFKLRDGSFTALNVPVAGASQTTALGVNNLGEVVGYYLGHDGHIHGFLELEGKYVSIDSSPAATETQLYSINDLQEFVGTNFLYRHGSFIPLGDLNPSAANGVASGINDSGSIVGNAPPDSQAGFVLVLE